MLPFWSDMEDFYVIGVMYWPTPKSKPTFVAFADYSKKLRNAIQDCPVLQKFNFEASQK